MCKLIEHNDFDRESTIRWKIMFQDDKTTITIVNLVHNWKNPSECFLWNMRLLDYIRNPRQIHLWGGSCVSKESVARSGEQLRTHVIVQVGTSNISSRVFDLGNGSSCLSKEGRKWCVPLVEQAVQKLVASWHLCESTAELQLTTDRAPRKQAFGATNACFAQEHSVQINIDAPEPRARFLPNRIRTTRVRGLVSTCVTVRWNNVTHILVFYRKQRKYRNQNNCSTCNLKSIRRVPSKLLHIWTEFSSIANNWLEQISNQSKSNNSFQYLSY